MKALRFYGYRDIRLEDVPTPEPQVGEARLRITYASICATDIERWYHRPNIGRRGLKPTTIGHESAGRIESLGPAGVDGWDGFERWRPRDGEQHTALRIVLLVYPRFTIELPRLPQFGVLVGRRFGGVYDLAHEPSHQVARIHP